MQLQFFIGNENLDLENNLKEPSTFTDSSSKGKKLCAQKNHWSLQDTERSIRTIQGLLNKVELSISAYDTTWAAMVPSGDLKKQEVGSWSLDSKDCQLVEDSISSRLASLLSLRKWRGGEKFTYLVSYWKKEDE